MDITDYQVLLKKFDETRNELDEAENNYRILQPGFGKDSKFNLRYEKEPQIFSFKYTPSKSCAYKRPPKLSDLYESSEESAYKGEIQRKKVFLKSAVVTTVRNSESRKDVICKQNINQKVRTRNCRILGMLQSTLQKFKDDAVKRQPQDLKRKRLEQKVEAAKEEEKRRMKREKAELFFKIKEKKLQLDCLKQMMMITESFDTWKCNKKKLLHFIITKAEPPICYLPASHTPSSKKRLEKSRTEVQECIQKQAAAVMKELAEIQDSCHATDSTTVEENLERQGILLGSQVEKVKIKEKA